MHGQSRTCLAQVELLDNYVQYRHIVRFSESLVYGKMQREEAGRNSVIAGASVRWVCVQHQNVDRGFGW